MLEIACFNPASALTAFRAGASRIELCAGASVGGTTPSKSDLEAIKSSVRIPINVMIRPRGGDFVYTDSEFSSMKRDIEIFRDSADGFVFGILKEDGDVDEERCRELIKLVQGKPCTFHRAFDVCKDRTQAAEIIDKCGFRAVLTSGGRPTALEGVDEIRELQEKYSGRLAFILGGGVRSKNMEALKAKAGKVEWFHSAAILDGGEEADEAEVRRLGSHLI